MLTQRNLFVVVALCHGLGTTTALTATKSQLDTWLGCACVRHWSCVASLSFPISKLGILGRLFGELLDSGFL